MGAVLSLQSHFFLVLAAISIIGQGQLPLGMEGSLLDLDKRPDRH